MVFGDDNFSVGADGALSLTAEIAATSTLTASVAVNDGLSQITLGYTLNWVVFVLYSRLSTVVDYDGSGRRFFDTVGWDSLSGAFGAFIIAAAPMLTKCFLFPAAVLIIL